MKKCADCGKDFNDKHENDKLCPKCKREHKTNKKWFKWFQEDKMEVNPTKLDKIHINTL